MDDAPIFVLFGATGDLAKRMLFPSLYFLHREELLAPGQRIIATSRSDKTYAELVALIRPWVEERAGENFDQAAFEAFTERLSYVPVDAGNPASFSALRSALADGADEAVFYLSTSPEIFTSVVDNLKAVGLTDAPNRIVVEKPMGHDLESCVEINDRLAEAFSEDRTFRIDHYLGKETVQNLLALRFGNTIFEPLWTANAIENVQITISETVGAEGRGGYYDAFGAVRDMMQNHLLQLLCLITMEPPSSLDADAIRNEKVKVLKALAPIDAADAAMKTVRGQYGEGFGPDGSPAADYLADIDAAESTTETYVAVTANVENWRWSGVPFYLQTGKRMAERKTEIVVNFKAVPHSIFAGSISPNELIIALQPREEITLNIMSKCPGLIKGGMALQELPLNLTLTDHLRKGAGVRRRIAYEQLILDALNNNPALFVQRDEQEAAWRWIDGIVSAWSEASMAPKVYRAGSDGPPSKHMLTERLGHSWHD